LSGTPYPLKAQRATQFRPHAADCYKLFQRQLPQPENGAPTPDLFTSLSTQCENPLILQLQLRQRFLFRKADCSFLIAQFFADVALAHPLTHRHSKVFVCLLFSRCPEVHFISAAYRPLVKRICSSQLLIDTIPFLNLINFFLFIHPSFSI
jgi:hypothetical protein